MAKGHKQRAGSRAYWPKKRAKRIYPRLKAPAGKELTAFAAYKAGMTQVAVIDSRKGSPTQGKEVCFPATVMAAPNMVVAGVKAYKQTPYGLRDRGVVWMKNLSKDLSRKTSVPKNTRSVDAIEEGCMYRLVLHTKPREVGKKRPEVFEIPIGSPEKAKELLGKEISVANVFTEGEFIDVRSVSKGKGTQGPVKRFGVTIRNRKAKKKRRHIGVLAPRGVARVLPNSVAMAGQLGFQTRTEHNKHILKIGTSLTPAGGWLKFGELKGSYIIVKGSVPGPTKRLIMLRKGIRAPKEYKLEVRNVITDSQQ